MDGGCTPSNGHAFVAARSHSATVALTTPPWVAQSVRALPSCSAKVGGPCGLTAPSHGESARGGHVRDLGRERLASGKLYLPLTRTVACARGPPSITPTRLAAARHAPEGPRAAPSCDGCAAPLALSDSGEHGPDVLSTPSAQLQAGSSDRAVATRERRWLGERVDWAVRRARREPLRGVRERPPVLATAASGQAKHHPVYPGASTVRGAIGHRLGGAWGLMEYALV